MAKLDENGHELLDSTPIALPLDAKRPETLAQQIQRLVRTHISREAEEAGLESFEDAEDFDVGEEDFDPSSPYEEIFDPVLGRAITVDEFRKNEAVYRQRYLEAEEKAYRQMEVSDALRARPKKGVQGEQVPPAPDDKGDKKD